MGRTYHTLAQVTLGAAPARGAQAFRVLARRGRYFAAPRNGGTERGFLPGSTVENDLRGAVLSIAKVAEEYQKQEGEHVKTQTGMVLGTPLYMSPEQCRGAESVTAKGDVYSLGVMLFQMLSGNPPFTGQSMGELIALHLFEPPPDLAKLEPALPAELSALVMRMIAKQPELRPSMPEVVKELELLGADRTDLGTERRPELGPPAGAAASRAADANVATNLVSGFGTASTLNDQPAQKATTLPEALQQTEPPPQSGPQQQRAVLPLPAPLHQTAPPSTLGGAVGERAPAPAPDPAAAPGAAPPGRTLLGIGGLVVVAAIGLTVAMTQRRPAQAPQAMPERAAAATAAATVKWSITSDPQGAQVIRKTDGKVLGVTPLELTPEPVPDELVLILRRDGFFDKELKLDPTRSGSRSVILVPMTDNQVKILE